MKSALVIGLGSSGEAAARLLLRQGAKVTLMDDGNAEPLRRRAETMRQAGVFVLTGAGEVPQGDFEVCVLSPGVPFAAPCVVECRRRGIPVLAELELGWRCLSSRMLAVTGSNGKSTLAKFCRDTLRQGGYTAEAGANYGVPLSAMALLDPAPDWVVAEVSSFQLETVERFAPDVAILLNINPNHLDRHATMEEYREMKSRLFRRQGPGCLAVLPDGDVQDIRDVVPDSCAVRTFGVTAGADYRYESGWIKSSRLPDPVSIQGSIFDNEVMGGTAAACVAAMEGCVLDPANVSKAAAAFERLPHRMQTVAVIRGISFVNDSKATNLAAMSAGIRMVSGPVRLIAGGLLKESDLDSVKKILVKQVRAVYVIGKYASQIADAWRDVVPCVICTGLKEAVGCAWREASAGETILLSPGCASFDQFRSFEDRGEQFAARVLEIKQGEVK